MRSDPEKIADLIARVKNFCAHVAKEPLGIRDTLGRPVEDRYLTIVPQLEGYCEAIQTELSLGRMLRLKGRDPECEQMLARSEQRLELWLAELEGALRWAKTNKVALAMAGEIGRARKRSRDTGARGGKAGGYKGGRPSRKPSRVDLQKRYSDLLACGNERDARAQLVKDLQTAYQIDATTARDWVRDAGI